MPGSEFLRNIPGGHVSGEIEGSATAKQLSDIDCQMVMLQGKGDNAGNVHYGFTSGVTVPDGTADTTSGIALAAAEMSPWIPVKNLDELYIICDNAGDDVIYHCVL